MRDYAENWVVVHQKSIGFPTEEQGQYFRSVEAKSAFTAAFVSVVT